MSTTSRPMTVARMRSILDALDDTDLITDTDGVPLLDAHTDTGVLELAFAPRRRRAVRNTIHATGDVSNVMQIGGDFHGHLRL